MAAVYVNNLVINSGTDFSQSFTLEDPASNSAFNLTQYSISSQMRKWAGSSTAITFTSAIEIAILGKINISLTYQQTASLKPGRYVYDIIITDNENKKNKVVEGMVLVREGVTR
jgi:hypothetical protein